MPVTVANSNSAWKAKVIIFAPLTVIFDSWELCERLASSETAEEARTWRVAYIGETSGIGECVPSKPMVEEAAPQSVGLPKLNPEKLLSRWSGAMTWSEIGSVLRSMKESGYDIGVIMNCSTEVGHVVAPDIAKIALHRHNDGKSMLSGIVTEEEERLPRPRTEGYMAILDAIGVQARDTLFVGGSADDVKRAALAGLRVAWYSRVGLLENGNWSPLHERKAVERSVYDFDTDSNWSPLPKQKAAERVVNESDPSGNWSPLDGPQIQSKATANESARKGNWSPLLTSLRVTNDNWNWFPPKPNQTPTMSENGPSANDNWSLLQDIPSSSATSSSELSEKDGSWSPMRDRKPAGYGNRSPPRHIQVNSAVAAADGPDEKRN